MIGFIGIGVMGQGMVHNLLKAGYDVGVYTRTKQRANSVIDSGAKWFDSPVEVAKASTTVITMVGYPEDVKSLYDEMKPFAMGKLFIDMTTSTPTLAKEIALQYKEAGADVLDAPVSGGDIGAKNGTLAIMVGGSENGFKLASPLFEVLGKTIEHLGESGAGQHTKCANQVAVAGSVLGMAEALHYAEQVGLSKQHVLSTISKGAAGTWSLDNYAPRILKGDYEPGFYVEHYVKDLNIVLEEAKKHDFELPGTRLVENIYSRLLEMGYGKKGVQAIQIFYDSK